MNFKRLAKTGAGFGAGLGPLQVFLTNRTVIFMFHRVVPESYYNSCKFQKSILVTETGFSTFIGWAKANFSLIPLASLLEDKHKRDLKSTKQQAIVTFDDGWRDNYEYAFPIMQKERVPATIFLSTDYIDSPLGFWWQSLGEMLSDGTCRTFCGEKIQQYLNKVMGGQNVHHDLFQNVDATIETLKEAYPLEAEEITTEVLAMAGKEPVNHSLSWDQCREMSRHEITFGSHTLSHPKLPALTPERLEHELEKSKAILQEQNLNFVDAICYPYGSYDESTLQCAAKHYRIGVTTDKGIVNNRINSPLCLPRINVPQKVIPNKYLMQYRLLKASLKIE